MERRRFAPIRIGRDVTRKKPTSVLTYSRKCPLGGKLLTSISLMQPLRHRILLGKDRLNTTPKVAHSVDISSTVLRERTHHYPPGDSVCRRYPGIHRSIMLGSARRRVYSRPRVRAGIIARARSLPPVLSGLYRRRYHEQGRSNHRRRRLMIASTTLRGRICGCPLSGLHSRFLIPNPKVCITSRTCGVIECRLIRAHQTRICLRTLAGRESRGTALDISQLACIELFAPQDLDLKSDPTILTSTFCINAISHVFEKGDRAWEKT
jgi:hypothetical protein